MGRNIIPSRYLDHVHRGYIEEVFPHLPDESVDCIFADPDYNVGIRYGGKTSRSSDDEYLDWSVRWATECHRVLKRNGNLFIVNYGRNNARLRVEYLDHSFERVYDYVWVYHSNIGCGRGHFTTAHRSILHCVKSAENRFFKSEVAEPYRNPRDPRVRRLIDEGSPGRMPYSWLEVEPDGQALSWFKFELVKNVSRTKTFHSCQIPEQLTEKLIRVTTRRGDTVLIPFGGAGSEIAVCLRLKRHWVSAEPVPEYCKLIERRIKLGGSIPKSDRFQSKWV